jgi:hypothetical protein
MKFCLKVALNFAILDIKETATIQASLKKGKTPALAPAAPRGAAGQGFWAKLYSSRVVIVLLWKNYNDREDF